MSLLHLGVSSVQFETLFSILFKLTQINKVYTNMSKTWHFFV